jgi:hypothetical protein
VLNYGATNVAPTQKDQLPPLVDVETPFQNKSGLGTNRYFVMGPTGLKPRMTVLAKPAGIYLTLRTGSVMSRHAQSVVRLEYRSRRISIVRSRYLAVTSEIAV